MKPSPQNPSLQTIADLTGVCRATVSLALRNQECIPERTRTRIKQVADSIGYRPNPLVSTLMAHIKSVRPAPEAGAIAFLTSHPTRNGWREYSTVVRYYNGASERAQRAGYRLDEMWLREPGMSTKKMKSVLINRGIQGILVAPLPKGSGHLSLDVSTFALSMLGHTVIRPKLHRAAHHHIEAVRIAVHNLRHLGYRRIGFALHESQDRRNDLHWSTAFAGYQLGRPERERIPIFSLDKHGEEPLRCWLDEWKPDVVLSGNSEILPLLERMGIPVPDRLGVAVLDLSPTDHGVTGIDQMPEVVGAAAIDLIVGQIQRNERGIPSQAKLIVMDGNWVPGTTVRKVDRKSLVGEPPEIAKSSKPKQKLAKRAA